jgi:hypothetical protein
MTLPVVLSSTRKSSGPRNAIVVGLLSPETTVRTLKPGRLIVGALWANKLAANMLVRLVNFKACFITAA